MGQYPHQRYPYEVFAIAGVLSEIADLDLWAAEAHGLTLRQFTGLPSISANSKPKAAVTSVTKNQIAKRSTRSE